jgi:hypothetical protein
MMSSNLSLSPSCSLTLVSDDLADQFMKARIVELTLESSHPPTPSLVPPPAPKGWWTVTFSSQPLELLNPVAGFQGGSL